MSKTKSFNGITPAIWECVKSTSFKEHGTVYKPPGAATGTATTSTIVGEVIMDYQYDASAATVNYTITKKPFIVSDNTIWDGIQDTINSCSASNIHSPTSTNNFMTKESSTGKLVFSNPAHPDSGFKPEMKSVSEVKAFASHVQAKPAMSLSSAHVPQVAVYEGPPDVIVTPANPLIISGSGPVSVHFGKVTIQPGGQIQVYTTADITIDTLIKV